MKGAAPRERAYFNIRFWWEGKISGFDTLNNYSDKLATDRARAVAFMKGYVKASRYYFDAALVQKDGHAVHIK